MTAVSFTRSFVRLVIVVCISGAVPVVGQNRADTLWKVWNDPASPDTARLKSIQQLAWRTVFELPDSGIALALMQLTLATKIDHLPARYEAFTTLAVGSSMKSDHGTSIEYLEQCLAIARAMKDPQREANTFSNMSNAYKNLGDLPMALELLQKSMRIDEDLGNDAGLAGTLNNIGNIHIELKDPALALDYYERSAGLYERLGDKRGMAQARMNLGATHGELGDRVKAMEELMISKELYAAMGRKLESGMVHNNLGRFQGQLGLVSAALNDLDKAEALLTEVGNKRALARTHYYRGELLLANGRAREAIAACMKGREIAEEGKLPQQRMECNECLTKAYERTGDFRSAFHAQQAFISASDSIELLNNSREVTRMEVSRSFQERQITDSLAHVRERYERELHHQAQLDNERYQRNLFILGGVAVLILAGLLANRLRYVRRSRALIQKEKDRSDELLHNILPHEVAAELKANGSSMARQYEKVTILFTDFKGFTEISSKLSPTELVEELNVCFKAFDAIMEQYGLEKIKTIGDAYMATAGLPDPSGPGALEVVQAALDMQDFIGKRKAENTSRSRPGFEMRAGIHTGPVVAGIVGVKKFAYDVWGDTVNVAARMESSSEAGQVNISSSTCAEVQMAEGLQFTRRGMITVKGKGDLEMYFVQRATTSVHHNALGVPIPVGGLEDQQI